MRKFINKDGKFIITLPEDWFHKNKLYETKDVEADSFEFITEPVGTFQLTLTSTDKGRIPDIIKKHNLKSQEYGKNNLEITEDFFPSEKFDMHLWFIVVDNFFLMAKYIYNSIDRGKEIITQEITKARKALDTVIFVETEYQEAVLASFQFDKFMFSLVTSRELTDKAYKNNNPIELVILLANQIDAALRLCLILHEQIETESEYIDIKLIYQKDDDKAIMEKAIYKLALDKGIIDESLNAELYNLYNQRNKVVHRYIISEITTKEVMKISIDYSLMEKKIGEIVKGYEKRQFEKKVGIYGHEPADTPITDEQRKLIQNAINEKHSHYSFIEIPEKDK
ncbi:hypothetical protein MRP92_05375 [Flavobacterium covae]|uniref:hypothetical protein n=1 Tax=Flavobacterium covae TaxID=2906076 RepID=UPI001FB8536D|nr:hypothetical protein [Flavobacterium covae]MCJ1806342.1 hypothetical protein [Flavobacterium covae]